MDVDILRDGTEDAQSFNRSRITELRGSPGCTVTEVHRPLRYGNGRRPFFGTVRLVLVYEEVCTPMNKALRVGCHVLILLMFGVFVGCSDDDTPTTPVIPNPAGSIGVYADAGGTNPNVTDTGGSVSLFVVHHVEDGATASSFRVEAPAGWTMTLAQNQFPVSIGDPATGMSVGYGTCQSGAIHVMTLTYTSPGNTPAGAMFKVLPHTDVPSQSIEVVDCTQNLLQSAIGVETPVSLP
jgi:hypothetical protein